jgi:hypothetical protein
MIPSLRTQLSIPYVPSCHLFGVSRRPLPDRLVFRCVEQRVLHSIRNRSRIGRDLLGDDAGRIDEDREAGVRFGELRCGSRHGRRRLLWCVRAGTTWAVYRELLNFALHLFSHQLSFSNLSNLLFDPLFPSCFIRSPTPSRKTTSGPSPTSNFLLQSKALPRKRASSAAPQLPSSPSPSRVPAILAHHLNLASTPISNHATTTVKTLSIMLLSSLPTVESLGSGGYRFRA